MLLCSSIINIIIIIPFAVIIDHKMLLILMFLAAQHLN